MLAIRIHLLSLATVMACAWSGAVAQSADDHVLWRAQAEPTEPTTPSLVLGNRDALGLPGLRPRLTMRAPLSQHNQFGVQPSSESSAFSWSLEAWQLNTASLAHIQCNQHTLTIDTFVAEDCRFVDEPTPDNAVNLVQVRGEWVAAPGLTFGVGAFHSQTDQRGGPMSPYARPSTWQSLSPLDPFGPDNVSSDGLDLNVSFGISTDRVGDFLVGLQVARYRQRMSMTELGLMSDPMADFGAVSHYANSAQLSLGWRRGSFGGDLLGQHRDAPLWLAGGTGSAPLNSFDLEFSWRPRNASLSVGISNVLDAAPRVDEPEAGLEDPLENVFGRIPYVRYKHDL